MQQHQSMPHIYSSTTSDSERAASQDMMKRGREDDASAMGDESRSSYPHHREDDHDDDDEEEEVQQGQAACDVLLSLSSSCWPSPSNTPTRCSTKRHRRRRGQDDDVFECRTCGRKFPTFQALGGHRTSHLRRPAMTKKKPAVLVHACGACGMGFSTGQALGGHMRRHRMGRAESVGAGDVGLTQIIVHGRPTSTSSSSLQLLNLFV